MEIAYNPERNSFLPHLHILLFTIKGIYKHFKMKELKEMIQTFHVRQAFVGTDGYDKEMGFTGKDLMRSEVVQYISAASDKVIVLTDSSKFDKRGTVRRFALSQVYEVITDEKLSKQNIATLENAGIMVKVVS